MKYFDFDDGLYETYQKGRQMAPDVREQWMTEISDLVGQQSIGRLLDLGAGTGRFSEALGATFDAHVVAVDPAARMLSQIDPQLARVTRVVARAEADLPGHDQSKPFPVERV